MTLIDNIKILTGKKPLGDETTDKLAKKILLVEDDVKLSSILETRLKDEGFTVLKAANGKEGLDLALTNKPDLILLDLMMPVMDGTSMLGQLRQHADFKMTPVIVLTNAGEIENIQQTQMYFNAIEFLIKSNVSMEQIVAKVKSHTLGTPIGM